MGSLALLCLVGLFATAFAAAMYGLVKSRSAKDAAVQESVRLKSENDSLRMLLASKDEGFAARLADRERSCTERLAEQRNTFDATIGALRNEFTALVEKELDEKARSLSEKNAKDVKPLFDALKERIADFKICAEKTREANVQLGAELKSKLGEVGQKAQSLGQQAENFIAALKGGNKKQGNWGEGIVRNALEGAGLKSGVDFVEQEGARDAGLPDFTVFDGGHRKILIDAKVNIDAFLSAVQASDEGRSADAEAMMKDHAKSVRSQIVGLSGKEYPKLLKEKDGDLDVEYSPVVIMAMPSEATYAAALSVDPAIGAFANEKNVVLASPQMLFGYLVLFKLGIDRLKVDRNNLEIGKRAEQILARLDAAFVAFEKVGKSLDDAQRQYKETLRKVGYEDGGLNVRVPARELLKLTNSSGKRTSLALRT